jgi:SAM-dependent methyltransferase
MGISPLGLFVWVGSPTLYACPKTHAPLVREDNVLRATVGGKAYAIDIGIPNFLIHPPMESEADTATLKRLNEVAPSIGWRNALAQTYGSSSRIYQYVTDTCRASFIDALPLAFDSTVLEIGPGLGQFTGALAARSRHVYSLEVVAGQALFTAERCRQDGHTNISIACGGDDCRLPYVDSSFDVVVCNLVLEWCAGRDPREDPRANQERFLAEMVRVLKPGGALYLSTKNRFAMRYLVGGRDDHAHNIRFGSALPIWLLSRYLRFKGLGPPNGTLHSHSQLQRMLLRTGLRETRWFWAAPEMRYPTHFVPTDADSIRAARRVGGLVQGHSRLTRLLMPLVPAGLVKYVTPGLTCLARKPIRS